MSWGRALSQLSLLMALACGSTWVQAQPAGLTLTQALQLALQHSALTKASNAAVQASQEAAVKAGQLPDPMLKVGIDNVPVEGPDNLSTTRDFMTMRRIGIEQQWVSADKRSARSTRAQRAVELEEGNALANLAQVRRETAKAWINVLYGQRALAFYQTREKQTADELTAVQAGYKGTKATVMDVTQAQLARSQAQDAARKSAQALKTARLLLNRWTVVPVETVTDAMPPLASQVPTLSVEELETRHPMLLAARRAIVLADADTTVAVRERQPDWSIEAGVSQRPAFSNMVSIGVSIPLPINPAQRQDRDIAERSALGTKARLQYEDTLRQTLTDIQTLAATLASLQERLQRLHADVLPPALQQAELATAAYRAGTGSLSAVFNARKMVVERQLEITELEREAALTWAELEHQVLPQELAALGRTDE